ncbi:MAG: nitrogenase molybdenum-iron protein, alpha and beta chain [Clostridiales Family XIII bacterium]|jgi:nitrogenase molybdenum-iron protein beta chain|nr:nitrogenase molybdenum-iron protein, alpha and beta chain [Clostridiales Family XIII bacterium]
MCGFVEQERTTCALGGLYTALAMEGVLPVLHCGPGCQAQTRGMLANSNGAQNSHPFMESVVPCSNFGESDVVFGGADKLRKVIDHSLRAYRADMLIAMNGCTPEIVGDDIEEVVRSFSGCGTPVLFVEAAGFRGNNLYGHRQVLSAIISQYLSRQERGEKIPGLVNVFGIVPYYDTFWSAELDEIERLLTRVGLRPNIFYGRGKGLSEIRKIPQAEFNLLLSPWTDLEIVQGLKEEYGTPYFHYPAAPLGPTETKRFLRELARYAGLDEVAVGDAIREGEGYYYYYVNRSLHWIYSCRTLPKHFFVSASAAAALPLVRFMVNDMGLLPEKVYIPENVPEEHRQRVEGYFRDIEADEGKRNGFPISFSEDGGLMAAEIRDRQFDPGTVYIFGSLWDVLFCRGKGLPFLSVSAPQGIHMIGAKHYFGFSGGVNLFTDYYAALADLGPFGGGSHE